MPDPTDPVATANSYLGTPYVFGGQSKSGIDCSGLVQQAYPSLPRVAHLQKQATTPITDPTQLQRGDLVFLHNTQHNPPVPSDWASHVGIYDGSGNVIHAGVSKGVSSVPLSYFTNSPNFYGYGRVPGSPTMPTPKSKATKSTGLASVPQPQASQNPQPSDPSAAFNPGGGIDPVAYLQQIMGSRQQGGMSLPYDPYSPTPSGETFPNPANIGLSTRA